MDDGRQERPVAERGLRGARIAVAIVAVLAAGSGLAGIRKSLPLAPEVDESIFVGSASRMAASGSFDPQWFGHPGSTVMYPLALIYTVANLTPVRAAAPPAEPMPWTGYASSQAWLYFAGRALAVAYFVASVPLVFLIGRLAFSAAVGVIGALLTSVIPLSVSYAQVVRTDSAATFFGLLAMWCILKSLDDPSSRRQVLVGTAIGLAVASRYFMAALVPVWILSHLLNEGGGPFGRRPATLALLKGLAAAVLAFLIVTPYFLLHAGAVVRDLRLELEPTHLGADGLSPVGNLGWYLVWALPQSLSWPIALAALAGAAAVLKRPRRQPLVLAAFVGAFLVSISAWDLHWHRWTIQILPICCLFAAHGIELMVNASGRLVGPRAIDGPARPFVRAGLIFALLAQPAYQLARHDWQQTGTGPQMQARAWLGKHVPAKSRIASERYAAPLRDLSFEVDEQRSLGSDRNLADYSGRGYRYAVVSSAIYSRFLAEPERYPREAAFYVELFGTKELLKSFPPLPHPAWLPAAFATDCYCTASQTRGEPTIRIYRLD